MRSVRFVALGDSLTQGVGDPVGDGWRGWAALLAPSLVEAVDSVEFTNLAVSGAQTRDVLERQTPAALELRPGVVSVVIGVNDTLRHTFDIQAVAAHLDEVYATFTREGATLLTACLPDPGAMLGLPGALARPLARRQRAVNTVVHALSERYGAIHLHAADGAWITDRALWSADRLHPGERGHRQLAVRFHALLTEAGRATGQPPSPEPEFPAPTRAASLLWLATAGTAWVVRRCKDLLPQLLRLAADELHHRARGTSARLDLSASAAVTAALARLPEGTAEDAEAQRRPSGTSRPALPASARAAANPGTARAASLVAGVGSGVAGAGAGAVGPGLVTGAGSVTVAGVVRSGSVAGAASEVMVAGEVRSGPVVGAGPEATVPVTAPTGSSTVGAASGSVVSGAARVAPVVDAGSEAMIPGVVRAPSSAAGGASGGAVPREVRVASVAGAGFEAAAPGVVREAPSVAGAGRGGAMPTAARVVSVAGAACEGAMPGSARAASASGTDLGATVPDTADSATVPDAARVAIGTQAARTTAVTG